MWLPLGSKTGTFSFYSLRKSTWRELLRLIQISHIARK
jgi:hypothetical protein